MASNTPIMAKRNANIIIVVNVPMFPKMNKIDITAGNIDREGYRKMKGNAFISLWLTHATNYNQIENDNQQIEHAD